MVWVFRVLSSDAWHQLWHSWLTSLFPGVYYVTRVSWSSSVGPSFGRQVIHVPHAGFHLFAFWIVRSSRLPSRSWHVPRSTLARTSGARDHSFTRGKGFSVSRELAFPRPFDQPAIENKKPDQSSKRSRRKAAFLNRVSKSQERRAAGRRRRKAVIRPSFVSCQRRTRTISGASLIPSLISRARLVPRHVLSSQAHAFNPQDSTTLGPRMGTVDDNDGEILLLGSAHFATTLAGIHGARGQGAQSRSATWGRCKPPRFSRHGLASGWWGAVSKYLLLYLTCSQRNHGRCAAAKRIRGRSCPCPESSAVA